MVKSKAANAIGINNLGTVASRFLFPIVVTMQPQKTAEKILLQKVHRAINNKHNAMDNRDLDSLFRSEECYFFVTVSKTNLNNYY
jgi:hypothetical protein